MDITTSFDKPIEVSSTFWDILRTGWMESVEVLTVWFSEDTWIEYVPATSLSLGVKLPVIVFSPLTVSLKGTLPTVIP
jgi:hypothetical protein